MIIDAACKLIALCHTAGTTPSMDDWAAMLDFAAEIQSNKLNFAFTIGNFTKLPLSHHKKQLEELTRTKLA